MVSGISKAALIGALLQQASPTFAQTNGTTCDTPFKTITASTFFSALNPGWNVGNTLDAIETEGSWNNPPVVAQTFDDIKAAGFKSVRLPVTWTYHFKTQAPDYTVDPVWLQRVSDVLDMITSRGLYAIVNVHHDSWTWADHSIAGADIPAIEDKFYKLWTQIGTKLACKSEMVAFEPINEPPGTTAEHGAEQNKLNDLFLKAINEAGGHNSKRVVQLVGSGQDGAKTSQWFKRPDAKWKNPWGIQYHYYSPYDFIFGAWGKTTWGSDADKASLENDIASVRGNFTDVPLVIGEWQGSSAQTETAARWRYMDFFLRTAAKYNTSTVIWDNGADMFDRAARVWRDEIALSILQYASKGTKNALPDSTTDGAATTQSSSAYIYHKANSSVTNVTLPFKFNGNALSKIAETGRSGKTLTKGKDYTVAGESVTFSSQYLSTIITPSSPLGPLKNLTLTFSSGTPLRVNILQYTTPALSSGTPSSTALPATSSDIHIPLTPWPGHNRPAAVRAVKSDGTYLVDDWTQYLGPLQQGRMTYEGQWNWDATGVVIRSSILDAVRAAGKSTTFTIEFWPREPGNSVNYTLTV